MYSLYKAPWDEPDPNDEVDDDFDWEGYYADLKMEDEKFRGRE